VTLGVGAQFLRPLPNLSGLGAEARIIHHFFDVAQSVGPVSEIVAGDGPAIAAARGAAGIGFPTVVVSAGVGVVGDAALLRPLLALRIIGLLLLLLLLIAGLWLPGLLSLLILLLRVAAAQATSAAATSGAVALLLLLT